MKKVGQWLGKLLGAAGFLAALVSLCVTIIVAQPQPSGEPEPAPQPLLTASPGMEISSEQDLRELAATFPAPIMSFMSGSGMVFVSGTSRDVPWQGQYGRMLTLYWQTPMGEPLILQSIYPAEGLELMGKGDYAFSSTLGPALFGQTSVRMENEETVRVHVQAPGRGLYVLTVPSSLSGSLSNISRSIQLFTAD